MTDTDRLDALAAADNLPQWAMVGPGHNRHMEAVRPGHYWDIAEVRPILVAVVRERDELREAAEAAFTDFVYAQGSDFDRTDFPGMARLELYLDDGAALHHEDGA